MKWRARRCVWVLIATLMWSSCGERVATSHPIFHWTGTTQELADQLREMMNSGSAYDMRVLRAFDEQRMTFAFDSQGRAAHLVDPLTGRVHELSRDLAPPVRALSLTEKLRS